MISSCLKDKKDLILHTLIKEKTLFLLNLLHAKLFFYTHIRAHIYV